MSDAILSALLALGSAAALAIGLIDVVQARRGHCRPEQPVGLIAAAAAFAWLSFAVWPR